MVSLSGLKNFFKPGPMPAPLIRYEDLPDVTATTGFVRPTVYEDWDGDKFPGGFGATKLFSLDYWTIRQRSAQLFTENLYARGLVRRLVTNEINTGLSLECAPDAGIIGMDDETLLEWTDSFENRFNVWANTPHVCDYHGRLTFGAIQRVARLEALVSGDVLVVLRYSPLLKTTQVQLINGACVQTPVVDDRLKRIPESHSIRQGVERDGKNKIVAYWIRSDQGTFERMPAVGPSSGRKMAWLVFGTDKRMDDERGLPLLSIVLQSLKEIDRYRDSVQRKAVVNSILAMFIKKTMEKPGSLPLSGGAVRNSQATVSDDDGKSRTFNIANRIPGLVIEELQAGEEPQGFNSHGTDTDFAKFEEAIIQAVAWAHEVPPEILRLAFSNNYSASQAAINEFKIYLNRVWSEFGEGFCTPVYIDVLLSEVLAGRASAPGFIESWRDPEAWDVFGAWVMADWYGSIKPSTDMLKQAKGSKLLVENGWSTNAREARINTGTKFDKNVKKLKRENEKMVEAMRPLREFEAEFGKGAADPAEAPAPGGDMDDDTEEAVLRLIEEQLEERGQ